MFHQMQQQGLTPDVVTYTAIISAYEKGGQWRMALSAYEQMRERGCRPDAIVFNAIIDALWETGVIWAQRKVRRPSHVAILHMTYKACPAYLGRCAKEQLPL